MRKKAFINALLAEAYIVIVVHIINYGRVLSPDDTILIPIAMLSLFVLSAAVMGYLFLAEPVQMYVDGERKQAMSFFLSTVLIFAIITGVVLLALFLMVNPF